jgi:hypothetical protein
MQDPEPTPAAIPRSRHWLLFVAGIVLFLVGPPLYFIQFRMKHLFVPWYVPLMATAGVALMIASLWRRRGIGRGIALVLFAVLCGLEWSMLAVEMKTPQYTGPAQPGRKVPEFTATLANGTAFSEKDLTEGNTTILLFFRGRW